MTTHYHIDTSDKLRFKVSYRSGRFLKIEHVRGKITQEQINAIGKLIPAREDRVPAFAKAYHPKGISYTAITKAATPFKSAMDAWNSSYQNWHDLPPKINGTEVNALKQILKYLQRVTGNQEEALTLWNAILTVWPQLDEFHRNHPQLSYINSQLNTILKNVNTINKKGQSGVSSDYLDRIMRDLQSS